MTILTLSNKNLISKRHNILYMKIHIYIENTYIHYNLLLIVYIRTYLQFTGDKKYICVVIKYIHTYTIRV